MKSANRTILIAGMGTSPAVLTETVWVLTRYYSVIPKMCSRFLCFGVSVILSIRAIAGSVAASYEVGFDYNYRSYDAIFPRMRESFLENDTNVTSHIVYREATALLAWQRTCCENGPTLPSRVSRR